MNAKQINEAIAVHLGWKKCACGDEHCNAWFPPKSKEPELGLPDYFNLMRDVIDEKESCDRILDYPLPTELSDAIYELKTAVGG